MQRPTIPSPQNLQNKQSIQFLTSKDINPSIRLIINNYVKLNKITPEYFQISNISAHLQKFLKFVIEKNTSFIVRQNYGNNQVIGCCINLDVKDLISIFDTTMNFAVFQSLGMFTQKLKNWLYRLGDSARGDYLYNVVTVFIQNQLNNNPIDYILKGIAFSKVIGWKNILHPTTDPFLMLKLGGQIIGCLRNNSIQNLYSKENNDTNNHSENNVTNSVVNEKIELQKVPFQIYTYIMSLKLDQTKIYYLNIFNVKQQNDLVDNFEEKDQNQTKKLYISPKL